MRVFLTESAKLDLLRIGDFIARDNPRRALSFVRELREAVAQLSKMPEAFPLVPGYEEHGIRRWVHGNYLILSGSGTHRCGTHPAWGTRLRSHLISCPVTSKRPGHLPPLLSPKHNHNMSSPKTAIATTKAPAAIGPYSQAVRVGDFIYTSGQVALDPATGQIVAGAIAEQTTRVLENLKAVLDAAGSTLASVVKTTVFLKDMNDFAAMNAIYGKYLAQEGAVAPARSTVEVARLPKDALVEIEVIAQL